MWSPSDSLSDEQRTSGGRQSKGQRATNGRGVDKAKKRVRNWTADDRANHRVFERSRREAFKERLQSLAALVPSLQNVDPSRTSKHVVIDESIAMIQSTLRRVADSQSIIDTLLAERQQLITELNNYRANPSEPFPPMAMQMPAEEASNTESNYCGILPSTLHEKNALLSLSSPALASAGLSDALNPPPRGYAPLGPREEIDASTLWQLSDLVTMETSGAGIVGTDL